MSIDVSLYPMIYKRKSFHLFRNIGNESITSDETKHQNNVLYVYRYKKEGKRGIMPADKVTFYNQIDIGIFLCFLELCLEHNGISFECKRFVDVGTEEEKTIVAAYSLMKRRG